MSPLIFLNQFFKLAQRGLLIVLIFPVTGFGLRERRAGQGMLGPWPARGCPLATFAAPP